MIVSGRNRRPRDGVTYWGGAGPRAVLPPADSPRRPVVHSATPAVARVDRHLDGTSLSRGPYSTRRVGVSHGDRRFGRAVDQASNL